MNKEQLEKMFDENFDMSEKRGNEVKQFIFETIIPEVLNSVFPTSKQGKYYIKQKTKELYDIDL